MKGLEAAFLGVDLGRAKDYSAIGLLGRKLELAPGAEEPIPKNITVRYHLLYAKRFDLFTEYEYIMDQLEEIWQDPDLAIARRHLVVDQGQVGAAIIEALRKRGLPAIGVTITSGYASHQPRPSEYNVPKPEIVTALVGLAQMSRLVVPEALPEETRKELEEQFANFGYKINRETARIQYEALEEKVHDDLILALALGVWYGETVVPAAIPGRRKAHIARAKYNPLNRSVTYAET